MYVASKIRVMEREKDPKNKITFESIVWLKRVYHHFGNSPKVAQLTRNVAIRVFWKFLTN